MPPAGIEHKIPAIQRPQTHGLYHTATGIGTYYYTPTEFHFAKQVSSRVFPTTFPSDISDFINGPLCHVL